MNKSFGIFGVLGLACCLTADAEILDRPTGIKIGQRMTLRPYVTMSMTYDSNVNSSSSDERSDVLWTIGPSATLHYNAESWSLLLTGYYNYRQYMEDRNDGSNRHEYGETLRWNWANSSGAERGWTLQLGQSFQQLTMADDLTLSDGSRYSNDSRQFQFSGALQRRFNEYVHGDVNGSYYWLDYDNSKSSRNTYYGWDRWLVGAEAGYAPSKWTDFLLTGSYQGYTQDNLSGSGVSGDSRGWSVQGGLGSYMTERISYRLLAGWSRFEYGDTHDSSDGFVYTATGNWKIGETWNTMLLATSYYQPSERQYASKSRVDALSWGIAKLLVRGSLRATLDIRYRRETHEYTLDDSSGRDWDYVLNIITGRVGLDYTLNRFFGVYGYFEYQKSMNDEDSFRNGAYDYDRWRGTVGIRLSY